MSTSNSKFAPYQNALKALSVRTGTPLSSLILSFAIIHEATAIVPLVGFFYGARTLGVGEQLVDSLTHNTSAADSAHPSGWIRYRIHGWLDEGEQWAGRVGRRYGVFGFEKGQPVGDEQGSSGQLSGRLAGDVANAVLAYGITKALIPLRIGLSLYFSPAFSRRAVDPIRANISRLFKSKV
ncbi:hypothetical protein SERLA73DRAFT_133922 [Serpula lacrymans var. lacrymans S7.3]|uniref:Uncharacterized protein n=2 Tax=Serpula lacrymans var. lacrymans TaxID=341189 RepID=F8PSY9_SERL3|nr:uncharacterized protein SERLADRAFT_385169 [Serpula lacrymans var. lacrymans S7.9]EGO00847.1 hypothetical protein SERLA73DRAFT_133922 [Serpula lacrymans var. lacrymans S7.3]EGO26470.1 hypothetical protein SERLADRAFT_385169 [Serpula lacrymans var. lacrymans S7.9]